MSQSPSCNGADRHFDRFYCSQLDLVRTLTGAANFDWQDSTLSNQLCSSALCTTSVVSECNKLHTRIKKSIFFKTWRFLKVVFSSWILSVICIMLDQWRKIESRAVNVTMLWILNRCCWIVLQAGQGPQWYFFLFFVSCSRIIYLTFLNPHISVTSCSISKNFLHGLSLGIYLKDSQVWLNSGEIFVKTFFSALEHLIFCAGDNFPSKIPLCRPDHLVVTLEQG